MSEVPLKKIMLVCFHRLNSLWVILRIRHNMLTISNSKAHQIILHGKTYLLLMIMYMKVGTTTNGRMPLISQNIDSIGFTIIKIKAAMSLN